MAADLSIISEISTLTCSVCYEKISQTKTLYCGHSICSDPCLINRLRESEPTCPTCCVPIQLPPSGKMEDLPTKHGLGSVLRSYRDSTRTTASSPDSTDSAFSEEPLDCAEDDPQGEGTPGAAADENDCRLHHRALRFFCETCTDVVCYRCIQTIHSSHEFSVKDMSDDDGAYVKDVIGRTLVQRQRQKEVSLQLVQVREDYLERSRDTKEEIKLAASRVREMVTAEETKLLAELEALEASRSQYFMDLLLALEHTMVKENKFSRMVTDLGDSLEREGVSLGIRMLDKIDRAMEDIDHKTETLGHLCEHHHPHLQFSCRNLNSEKLIGTLQKVCRITDESAPTRNDQQAISSVLKLVKRNDIKISRDCVGVVWLNGENCIMVVDKTSSKGLIEFKIFTFDGEGGVSYQSEKLEQIGHGAVRVCGRASFDGSSILLAHGTEIIKVTFDIDSGRSPTYRRVHLTRMPEAVSWGQCSGQYFVLTSQPWQVLLVDANGSASVVNTLPSLVYGPYLATFHSNYVLSDIAGNVVIVNDATGVFPERSIAAPSRLRNAFPAGIILNPDTEEWFFLWKSTSKRTEGDVDWLMTRHTSSFDYRGVVMSGSMAERNPRHVALHRNKLAILFHGGKVLIYTISSYQVTEAHRPPPSS